MVSWFSKYYNGSLAEIAPNALRSIKEMLTFIEYQWLFNTFWVPQYY